MGFNPEYSKFIENEGIHFIHGNSNLSLEKTVLETDT